MFTLTAFADVRYERLRSIPALLELKPHDGPKHNFASHSMKITMVNSGLQGLTLMQSEPYIFVFKIISNRHNLAQNAKMFWGSCLDYKCN